MKRIGWIAAGMVGLAVLIWVGDLGWNGWGLWRAAKVGSALMSAPSAGTVEMAGEAVVKADASLRGIGRDVAPLLWLCDGLKGLPVVGGGLGELDPLLAYASHMARAGSVLYQAMGPALAEPTAPTVPKASATSSKAGQSLSQRVYAALAENGAALRTAADELQAAEAARGGFEAGWLPGKVQGYLQKADAMMPYMRAGMALMLRAPALLGGSGTQTYLVLAQNQDELRATGGFITAIGTIQVTEGQIGQFKMGDSYAVDDYSKGYPKPPEPIQKFMLAGYWVPRDGNWSPDFPSSAREVETLVGLSDPASKAGIISFDQSMVKAMLEVTGPIQVAGFAEPVTAGNVENFMHEAWAPAPEQGFSQEWWQNRKNFIPELGKAMIERLLETREAGQMAALGKTILSGMQQGHLEIYVNDAQAEAALAGIGLDGGLATGSGDYVMLVDSNIGFNKADARVQRGLEYQVDLSQAGSPKARVQMDYRNTVSQETACMHKAYYDLTYSQMQERCYWDYWRVYVPAGDQLRQAQIQAVPQERLLDQQAWDGPVERYAGEGGTQALAGLMVLPTQQSQQVGLDLALPGSVVQPNGNGLRYRLRVQKQAGLDTLALKVTVTAPVGMRLASGASGWQAVEGKGEWVWSGTIRQTTDFVLDFERMEK